MVAESSSMLKSSRAWAAVALMMLLAASAILFDSRRQRPTNPSVAVAIPANPSNGATKGGPASPAGLRGGQDDTPRDSEHVIDVWPGMDIQSALDLAADDAKKKIVRVHEGVYRPSQPAQALIYFNARHDGITLEADGEVVLSGANPDVADPLSKSFPAIVNHVVYFGDGISRRTLLRGFKITGANNFMWRSDKPVRIQPEIDLPRLKDRSWVHYADGGGIKVWGRSYPRVDRVEIYGNYVYPCGAAMAVENCGYNDDAPLVTNSIFRDNRSEYTGAAIDLYMAGNALELQNCLFVGNLANRGVVVFGFPRLSFHEENGSGALTVFKGSRVKVDHCTFTGNYNGVDDDSTGNEYTNCIFWKNDRGGGTAEGGRYEIDIIDGSRVRHCWIGGGIVSDLRGKVSSSQNNLNPPDPQFDAQYRPQAAEYSEIGYRPVDD